VLTAAGEEDLGRDPSQGSGPNQVLDTDICVVGAGPVGLTLTRALAGRGRKVTLLEQGSETPQTPAQGTEVIFDRREYRGATIGRAFGLGGTSALWGGQLLPLRESDLLERPQIAAPAWPIAYSELRPYFSTLESWLNVVTGTYAEISAESRQHPLGNLSWADWEPRFSKWIPFGRRNLAASWRSMLESSGRVDMRLYAAARGWQVQGAAGERHVTSVIARCANGKSLTVRARVYVICAGALESARSVLELIDAAGGLAPGVDALTGRYLHDHLSLRLARVRVADWRNFQRLFAPAFVKSTQRSLRMELGNDFLMRERLPSLYAHFVAEAAPNSGFAVLRDLLRNLQHGRRRAALAGAAHLFPALPGIAAILYGRLIHSRLLFPMDAELYLHCDFEQAPRLDNRIYLGSPGPDGRRTVHIDWDFGDDVLHVAAVVQKAFGQFWSANGLDRVARLDFLDLRSPDAEPGNLYDIYHPAGTTRMSRDPQSGVVDPNLLVYGTTNAFVVGSSVFPSMGAANPTFTAMALALRLAEFIDRRLAAS
jgi:hypothetical protein